VAISLTEIRAHPLARLYPNLRSGRCTLERALDILNLEARRFGIRPIRSIANLDILVDRVVSRDIWRSRSVPRRRTLSAAERRFACEWPPRPSDPE
jgi:hypothetical protein